MERRLAAILAADVVGYSRLMEQDEAGVFERLRARRKDLFEPTIERHHGRIFKLIGDGLLAEFPSVVDAVECAVTLQRGLAELEVGRAVGRRITVRIGINLGDVIVETDAAGVPDIHGEGVNVAARLEQLADAGGICVSQIVLKQVDKKVAVGFESIGEQKLKGIVEPVLAYRVLLGSGAAGRLRKESWRHALHRRWEAAALAAAAVIAAVAIVAWYLYPRDTPPGAWPSVAVLPFKNISSDRDQDYFSDGLTEELIISLGRIPRLVVQSRDATAGDKGQNTPNGDFGARYMVKGSVQRVGDQVRITAQLIETANNALVWGENYERPATEISTVRDEIVSGIALSIVAHISQNDLDQTKRKPPTSLSAYDLFLRGREQAYMNTPEGNASAIDLFKQALAADPTYADAMGSLANAYLGWYVGHWGPIKGRAALDLAYETAQRAVALDPTSPYAARALGFIYLFKHRFNDAVALLEQSVKSNPSNEALLIRLGDVYTYVGQPERGIQLLRQVYQLDPHYSGGGHAFIGRGLVLLNRQEEAVSELRTCSVVTPAFRVCHEVAAVAYAELGQLDEARAEAAEANRLDPYFTLASAPDVLPFKNPKDLQRFLDGLRKAGLPE